MNKKLTQAVFDDAPHWVKSAAVDADGAAYYYSVTKGLITPDAADFWLFRFDCDYHRFQQITGEWDTTNWQQSAIDRGEK